MLQSKYVWVLSFEYSALTQMHRQDYDVVQVQNKAAAVPVAVYIEMPVLVVQAGGSA